MFNENEEDLQNPIMWFPKVISLTTISTKTKR
jgi:hypothetical protein